MPHILTVDDSKVIRRMVRSYLDSSGIRISEATNGAEGLKVLLQGDFDLVLLDISMPVIDGVNMLKMKRAKSDATPVIMLTAECNAVLAQAMEDPCVMDYLQKPLKANALKAAIAQVLALSDAANTSAADE